MDTGKTKLLAKRLVSEIFSNPDVIKELCTPSFIAHHLYSPRVVKAKELIPVLKKHFKGGLRVVIDDCFAEDDRVAVRFRVFFTPLEGGGEIVRNEIAILRFKGEKVEEWWGAYDRQSEKEQKAKLERKLAR
jgi:hypothetical protein